MQSRSQMDKFKKKLNIGNMDKINTHIDAGDAINQKILASGHKDWGKEDA